MNQNIFYCLSLTFGSRLPTTDNCHYFRIFAPVLITLDMKKLYYLLAITFVCLGASAQDDATISINDVTYWVGQGPNRAVLAVNWAQPNTCYAWGVRFDGDSALVADLMRTVEIYDDRFSFSGIGGVVDAIDFHDGDINLTLIGQWWMYNINGHGAQWGYNSQYVHNGDVIKFGDESCGIADEDYNYTWTTPVAPVALPVSTQQFDGEVGSAGCEAIYFDDPAILGWATTCVINRGYQNIASPGDTAYYGNASDAIGPSSTSTSSGVVSLGDAGTAVLTFDVPIMNGQGYDFAVFENALNHTFLELAFVEVSSDGVHYYRFPSVSNTQIDQQIGNGGALDPRGVHNLAGKYIVGYGTPFDLEELAGYSNLDIDNITHIRIVDVVGSLDPQYGTTDKNGRIINDPYPTPWWTAGFDLSGVCVMNGWSPSAVDDYATNPISVYPNPCTNTLYVGATTPGTDIALYNAFGQMVWGGIADNDPMQLDMRAYPAGVYMVKVGTVCHKIIKQ